VEGGHPELTLTLALAVGVLAQSVARHLRIPGIVLLLVAGTSLGPDGLNWIQPRSLGHGLLAIVDLAVAVILFEGGLNLDIRKLRRAQLSIRRLVTVGALLTLAGAAAATWLLLDWPWLHSLLFGSLVVVTGPTVVGPLVRDLRLRPKPGSVLEAEGVLIDPIGAILAVLMLNVTLTPGVTSVATESQGLLLRLAFGGAAGVVVGFGLAKALRVKRLVPEGLENVFVLATVLILNQACEEVATASGLLAVTLAGVVVGNQRTLVDRDLREFKDQLTVMLIGLLFVLLAADVRLSDVALLGWAGVGVVAALVFVVRPLVVWISTAGSVLTIRERALIAWVAPRGIVAAAVASVTAVALESNGMAGGTELRALVFLTICFTVVLAGLTAGPVAQLLGQRLPNRDSVAILGVEGLSLALAGELRDAGKTVIFLDSNPQSCRRAEEAGFSVVFGDALREQSILRVRPQTVESAVGLTGNQMLNSLFVSRMRERFGVPRSYVAASQAGVGLTPELIESKEAVVLFEGTHDVERWNVQSRRGEMAIERWQYDGLPETPEGESAAEIAPIREALVMLAVRRGERIEMMHEGFAAKEGDLLSVAIHAPEQENAYELLRQRGWTPYVEPVDGEESQPVAATS
jgi:NhaP-type Na+/H+ or K+/H+ antiporter/Trk K+ transport system NAD-binding subunit